MSKKTTAAITTTDSILVVRDGEARALIAEAIIDMGAGAFDMDKISIPSGGQEFFTVEGESGSEAVKEIDVVLVAIKGGQKAWYRESYEDSGGGSFPECSSFDGVTGRGNRELVPDNPDERGEYECAACPWAQFGSARGEHSDGKDCGDSYHLIFYRLDAALPDFMIVPAGSLKAVRSYLMRCLKFKQKAQTVVTRITLEVTKNKAGVKFSRLVLKTLRQLDEAEREVFATLKEPCETLLLSARNA